jgi:hypothetical protein
MNSPARPAAACPACAAPVDGRFCAQCGTPVDGAACAGCRAPLTPGARFCHRCGTAAGATPAAAATAGAAGRGDAVTTALPWAFAAIALLSFGAYVAAQHFGGRGSPVAAVGGAAPGATGIPSLQDPSLAGIPGGGPRAPDISQMSPEERADRLFNRIMTAYEAGESEFVQNMAPMALGAYEMLPALDPMRRYDLGRILEVTGALPAAGAHADTLLRQSPTHLLGLALAARVADLQGDEARRAGFARRLVDAAPAELAKEPLPPEYVAHRNDINIALAEARRRAR